MGFFKTMKDAQKTMEQGMAMSQKYQAQADAATQPVDPNDPKYAPINGITVDQYAQIMAGLQKNAIVGPENVAAYAEKNGVPEGKWQETMIAWQQRMSQHQEVATRFAHIQNQFLS